MLKEIEDEVKGKNMTIEIEEPVIDFILQKGYDHKYGARPLRRTIQKYIEDELADMYIRGTYTEGSNIVVYVEGEEIKLK